MPYAELDDLRLYYEETGDGPPLLLLHGALGCIDLPMPGWDIYVPSFSQSFRVIQIEHRGHGRSNHPGGDFTYRQMAHDIAGLIKHMDLGPVSIAGGSDGGVIALNLALIRPDLVKRLATLGAHIWSEHRIAHGATDTMTWWGDPDALAEQEPELARVMARCHDRGSSEGWWQELVGLLAAMEDDTGYDVEALRHVNVPTLLILGDRDQFISLEQAMAMYRALPQAELLVVNGGDHFCFDTHRHLIEPVLLSFLDATND